MGWFGKSGYLSIKPIIWNKLCYKCQWEWVFKAKKYDKQESAKKKILKLILGGGAVAFLKKKIFPGGAIWKIWLLKHITPYSKEIMLQMSIAMGIS